MRARGAFGAAALLVSALFTTPLFAKKDGPTFKVHQFPEFPENLRYFENSDVIIFQHLGSSDVYRSPDAGATWERVEAVPEGKAYYLVMHQYDSERAYILTQGIQHYRTHDRGKTWDMFETDAEVSMFRSNHLEFHAGIPDRIIFNGMDCRGISCEEVAMYTTDGFSTAAKFLRGNTGSCWWAKSSRTFSTGDESKDKNRVLCIARDDWSLFKEDQRLVLSDNFFEATDSSGKIQEEEPNLDTDRPVQGVINLAIVKKFLLVATISPNTDEMALFVTDDTLKWHRAMFPTDHRIEQDAYTVLESTEYSIQIDVLNTRPSNPMGVMLTSNSNGTYFTRNIEHTNRNHRGLVDFEKVTGIQGIFLLNEVENWEEVGKQTFVDKKKVTKITFDDGRTFEDIFADGKRIHLHSVTELNNLGRVFSSPAPGLVMGIGNAGDYLKSYWEDGNLYISDDAGKTWIRGPEGPHKYEFGDQGSILVAVEDSKAAEIGEIKYSLDHGQTWLTAALPNDIKIRPWILTTTQDATTLKFILVGQAKDGEVRDPFFVIAIDFDGLHEDTCQKSDLEDWYARVDEDGKPTCLMGHTQKFQRRKKNAECFMKAEHKDLVKETEDCECTDQDFECDYNFVKADGKCITKVPIVPPEGACQDGKPDDTFLGPSGYRLIPGNTCKRKSGTQKDDKVERKCSEAKTPGGPASGEVDLKQHVFEGEWQTMEKHYLERGDSSAADDETILVWPKGSSRHGPISMTQDHGKTWNEIKDLPAQAIQHIITHSFFKDMVFFITKKTKVYYTADRGLTFHSFDAPAPPVPNEYPLSFHPDNKNWLLWVGRKCKNEECHLEASLSKDRGDHWETLSWDVVKCEFTGSHAYERYHGRSTKQILCLEKPEGKKDESQLAVWNDFNEEKTVVLEKVKNFATQAEFIIAATQDEKKGTLKALSSLDGSTFAEAHFPYNFEVSNQQAYTVLESSTHAINLLVVREMTKGRVYGSIMKSNSNGTSYVQTIPGVNCDDTFYVDFEKMRGLEGVALVNVVANQDADDAPKILQSKITHNDGAQWSYLPPPKVDLDGKPFCTSSKAKQNQGDEKCALHIHGFTEREDHRNMYSSDGAIGLMFGWGNVGSSLGSLEDADTFMTRDAGVTWTQVQKGRWKWSLGDQGSIIVLVQTHHLKPKTNFVYYSLDEGVTWVKKEFSEEEVEVTDISTMRSGGSRNFLIYGKKGSEVFTVNLDFTGLSGRECQFDAQDADASDYYLWSPKHPLQQNDCLFGHVSQYLRKKQDKQCYNRFRMERLYRKDNCTCTRQDYECDYNYELDNFGACHLVPGLQPLSHLEWCKENPDAVEYWEPTGYRRVPLTTCEGGQEFDKISVSHPCPGREDDYDRAHRRRISGFALFLAIAFPLAAAGAVGWWVWRNWSAAFGQIRLGEQPAASPLAGGLGGLLDSDAPWVRYPVIAVSALVAVVGAVPLLVAAAWRTVAGAVGGGARGGWSRLSGGGGGGGGWGARRFTTRDSFARGRGDYAVVDDDEGELLGEDSDEEV